MTFRVTFRDEISISIRRMPNCCMLYDPNVMQDEGSHDCCAVLCCPICSLAQEANEIKYRERKAADVGPSKQHMKA